MTAPWALNASLGDEEPRRVVSIQDFPNARLREDGGAAMAHPGRRAAPTFHPDWYDWALVWRYWHGMSEGLRRPYQLEVLELLRLGRNLGAEQLAVRLGVAQRTVVRWRSRYGTTC